MAVRDAASLLVGLLVLFHTWGALADVEVNMEDRVEVFRGETARITCMFVSSEGIGGLVIQWLYVTRTGEKQKIYYQDSTMKVVDRDTQFTDRMSVNGTGATGEVVLTISDVRLDDELEFICFIKSLTEGAGEGRTRLKVFETPGPPSIEGEERRISIHENEPSKIGTCEVKNGYPKPNITWYRNNTPLRGPNDVVKIVPSSTSESSGLFSVTSELSLKVKKADKDDEFYCEVSYLVPGETRMTETNRIRINVLYPATSVDVWVEPRTGKIKEGDSIKIHCHGNGTSPTSVTLKHAEFEAPHEDNVWKLDNVTRLNSGLYECTLTDMETFEDLRGSTSVFVNYLDTAVVTPDTSVVVQGGQLNAACNALASLQTHTAWFKNGVEVSKGNSLTLKDATFDTAGTYVCVVTVPEIEGMKTSGTLVVNVEGPPKISVPDNVEIEVKLGNTVHLSCHVRGLPAPSVIWTTSDGKVLKPASQEESEGDVHSKVSIKVTSDITAYCNASNKYGTDMQTFNIKATTHTTTPPTTPPATTITPATTTSISTIPSTTVKGKTAIPKQGRKAEGSGVVIAVIIICILLLAILGSVLYFLYKKGKLCGRSGKKDLTKEKSNKDNIVVEMKSDNTEEAVLLGVNGEKLPPSDQGDEYLDVQK